MTTPRTILITGAGGPLAVNITRSLKKAPATLRLIGTEANHYHVFLALTDKTVLIPPAKKISEYLEAMKKVCRDEKVEMIFPTHPLEVATLSAHRAEFPGVRLFLPEAEAIAIGQSKWKSYLAFKAAGLPVPETRWIATPADMDKCFSEISTRPIWVRGAGEPGTGIGVASLPCKQVEHAKAWVDYHGGWNHFIASEYLPGKNLTWTGVFRDGILMACQGRERLEYVLPHVSPSGITGAPAVSKTVSREDIRTVGEATVRAVSKNPNGAYFVDFKEDAAGKPRITEINVGRFGTTIHFYTEAGFNFPYLLVRLAFGEDVGPTPAINPVEAETYWIRTLDCGPVVVRNP